MGSLEVGTEKSAIKNGLRPLSDRVLVSGRIYSRLIRKIKTVTKQIPQHGLTNNISRIKSKVPLKIIGIMMKIKKSR